MHWRPTFPVWSEADEPPADRVVALLAWRLKPGTVPRYPRLRVVCSVGAGAEKLLVEDLPEHVTVTRVVDPSQAQEIAQYVLACTLRFTRELTLYQQQQSRAEWRRHPVRPASRCRVGLLGLGAVGQAVARAFAPLGYDVAAWVRRERQLPGVQVLSGPDGLPRLLVRSDVLVCTLPLTAATRGLLDGATLRRLPRGAYLVNVGRGEHLVEADLRVLLDEGHLAGAALDVFEREPPKPEHWIWRHPHVLLTPHVAAQASTETVAQQCVDALQRARDGLPQLHAIDRRAGY